MATEPPQAIEVATTVPLIRGHPIFASLTDGAVGNLIERGQVVAVEAGQSLVEQGDRGDAAYLLLHGAAEVFVETAYGAVTLAPIEAGSLFGEIGAFAGLPRTASVRARTAVQALRIERDDLLELGRRDPELLLSVIGQLGQRTATINRAIGFYTQALAALERRDFDPSILDELLHPVPELVNFAQTFRRMAEQIILRRAHQDEMASAAAIQRAMLPGEMPSESLGGRLEIHAAIRPAREVGGDLYDYFLLDGDRLALVVGDVSGKGVPASLFMAITRIVMRLALREDDDLAAAISRANALLSAENGESMFVTLFCGVLDMASGVLTYANCGHNPPFVLRNDGTIEMLSLSGLPLAILSSAAYKTRTITLAPADRLLVYTDGITEAADAEAAQFGEERLAAALTELQHSPARDLVGGVIRRVDEFAAGAAQFDDITCLALVYGTADQR